MAWENGRRYRFKVVPGEVQIEKNPKSGTAKVLLLAAVEAGPEIGQRMRWNGYLNSPGNQETTVAELRVMGWRGARLGDWAGLGSKEFEATAKSEMGADGKTYWRFAWPRPVASVNKEKAVKEDELAALNASLGELLSKPAADLPPAPTMVDGGDGEADISFP